MYSAMYITQAYLYTIASSRACPLLLTRPNETAQLTPRPVHSESGLRWLPKDGRYRHIKDLIRIPNRLHRTACKRDMAHKTMTLYVNHCHKTFCTPEATMAREIGRSFDSNGFRSEVWPQTLVRSTILGRPTELTVVITYMSRALIRTRKLSTPSIPLSRIYWWVE